MRGGQEYRLFIPMPTDSENTSVIEISYSKLKEDMLSIKERDQVVMLGDLNPVE